MGVGWIDRIYNNTDLEWQLKSVDDRHNGAISRDGRRLFTLDDRNFHALSPQSRFTAEWCGIPWYYNGQHFKAISTDQQRNVEFFTSDVAGKNWIYYKDGLTGRDIGRQEAPRVDFHCWLRFENDGNYIDILNDAGLVQETLTYILNEARQWVQALAPILAAAVKARSGP